MVPIADPLTSGRASRKSAYASESAMIRSLVSLPMTPKSRARSFSSLNAVAMSNGAQSPSR